MNERGLFLSWYMCLSDLMVKTPVHKTGDLKFKFQLTREVLGFEQTYVYEILVTEPLCTYECAGECCLSANLCKYALDVTADVIVEVIRNADILTINASEDFQ